MRTKQLEAKLEDLGVVDENDIVLIAESDTVSKSVYINVVSRLANHVCYIFQENKLVMIEGKAHIGDILKLKDLDLEEFE